MAQGLFGGATSYESQSIKDILEDINNWIGYTEEILKLIQEGTAHLKKCKFWDQIPFGFQMTLLSTITCQNTYLNDFTIIKESIIADKITKREVALLKKIGLKASEFNKEYGKTYKEEYMWKDYENSDFRVAEDLYAKGRDFFVTLQDASNASNRLEDYISELNPITNTNITQQISGGMNVVAGVNNGVMNQSINKSNDFRDESEKAIQKIQQISEIDQCVKDYIKELLLNATKAIEMQDQEKQEQCKLDYKGFVIGAGVNAFKVIGVLSSFASIASFLGITM